MHTLKCEGCEAMFLKSTEETLSLKRNCESNKNKITPMEGTIPCAAHILQHILLKKKSNYLTEPKQLLQDTTIQEHRQAIIILEELVVCSLPMVFRPFYLLNKQMLCRGSVPN